MPPLSPFLIAMSDYWNNLLIMGFASRAAGRLAAAALLLRLEKKWIHLFPFYFFRKKVRKSEAFLCFKTEKKSENVIFSPSPLLAFRQMPDTALRKRGRSVRMIGERRWGGGRGNEPSPKMQSPTGGERRCIIFLKVLYEIRNEYTEEE